MEFVEALGEVVSHFSAFRHSSASPIGIFCIDDIIPQKCIICRFLFAKSFAVTFVFCINAETFLGMFAWYGEVMGRWTRRVRRLTCRLVENVSKSASKKPAVPEAVQVQASRLGSENPNRLRRPTQTPQPSESEVGFHLMFD